MTSKTWRDRISTEAWASGRSGTVGGCDFAVDPAQDFVDADVLWLPQDDTSVVVLVAAPEALAVEHAHPGTTEIENTLAGHGDNMRIHLAAGDVIQLEFAARAPTPVAAVIPLDLDGFGRLEALHRLLAKLHGRAIPPDTRLTCQQRARARKMLQACDGARDGATQQDIAQVLFRTGRVSRHEWQSSAARHAVTSLLHDARGMIAGGYRKLLKHRRRH